MAAYPYMYLDRLLDAVSDLGAPAAAHAVTWASDATYARVELHLPGLDSEEIAPTIDGAAWLLMHRVFPDPDDQPGDSR